MEMYHIFYCEEFNGGALGDEENPLRKKFNLIVDDLKENKHTNLGDVKLIKGDGGVKYFRAKLSEADRLLFSNLKYNNKDGFVLLEVILNHEYNKSKFLKDKAKIKSIQIIYTEDDKNVLDNMEISNAPNIHWLGKFIKFSVKQEDIVENFEGKFELPLVVSGHAGSGKTSVALEKLKKIEEEFEEGKILFITQSEYLTKQSKELYEYEYWDESSNQLRKGISANIDFSSIHTFLEKVANDVKGKRAIDRNVFFPWFERICNQAKFKHMKKDGEKVFEEFTAVIAGGGLGREDGREQYLKLGKRQCIFSEDMRGKIYDLFEEFKKFVKESSEYYDVSLVADECFERIQNERDSEMYDVVVVDEVQDLTRSMLSLILKTSKSNFLLCGDVNQVIHPSFFSLSKLKDFLCKDILNKGKELKVCILEKNYRNSQQVIELANRILHFKNFCFASEDTMTEEEKKSFFMTSETENSGYVGLITNHEEIAEKVSGSTDYAILILTDSYRQEAKQSFETPLIFSVQEAKGLEFENVILFKFDDAYFKLWNLICPNKDKIKKGTIGKIRRLYNEGNVNSSKPKDKNDKSFEEHKFYMNALYVGVTRAVNNVYIIGNTERHKLLRVFVPGEEVNVVDTASIEKKASSPEEWRDMALDLIKKGNIDQAREIAKKLLHEVEYVLVIMDALKVHGWNQMAKEIESTLGYVKSPQPKSLLEKLQNVRYWGETLVKSSSINLSIVRSWSQPGPDNVFPWKATKEGSYYLENAYHLVNAYKEYSSGSVDDEYIQSINDVLKRLEFDPNHISYGYTDEVYDGKTECFVSKGQGKLYYKLLHSESRKDLRSFLEMVEPGIEIAANKFFDSFKQKLQSFFSEQFLDALNNNNPSAVEDCIKNGLIIENEVADGRTPLHHAVNKGNVAIVDILLGKGANPITATSKGNTPLHIASSNGHNEIIELLLQHVDRSKLNDLVNGRTSPGGDASLHIAAKKGFLKAVKSLLKYGAMYNIKNNEGRTPIQLSKIRSINNLLKLVEEVFEDAKQGNVQIVDKLKAMELYEFLAVIGACNDEKDTALDVVRLTESRKHLTFLRQSVLSNDNFPAESKPIKQKLPYVFSKKIIDAIKHNDPSAAKICISTANNFGFDVVNLKDINGRIPLHHAVDVGNVDIINVLLLKGADPYAVTAEGNTMLHIACVKRHVEVVEILLNIVKKQKTNDELSSFINARTTAKGTTALHVATINGYLEIVKLLLDYTADPNAKDGNGKTPLDLAQQKLIQDPKNHVLEGIVNILNQQSQKNVLLM